MAVGRYARSVSAARLTSSANCGMPLPGYVPAYSYRACEAARAMRPAPRTFMDLMSSAVTAIGSCIDGSMLRWDIIPD